MYLCCELMPCRAATLHNSVNDVLSRQETTTTNRMYFHFHRSEKVRITYIHNNSISLLINLVSVSPFLALKHTHARELSVCRSLFELFCEFCHSINVHKVGTKSFRSIMIIDK